MELVALQENLVDDIWGEDKPPMPVNKVFVHDIKYAGLSVSEKLDKVKEKLQGKVDALLVTTLDDIDWVLNLKGCDIQCNPVFFSYLILLFEGEQTRIQLFINKEKLDNESVAAHIKENNIEVYEYLEVNEQLRKLASENKKIAYDENRCNQLVFEIFKDANPEHHESVIELIKAMKNPVEMEGMRSANIKNCVSLAQYFAYLEDHLMKTPETDLDEYLAAEKLEEFRKLQALYVGPSFETISSMGSNGAVIHYKPEQGKAFKMSNQEIYLLDSGVQYLDGTTDITRTVHFGGCDPSEEQKQMYTRVLLGTLDLERIVWPAKNKISG